MFNKKTKDHMDLRDNSFPTLRFALRLNAGFSMASAVTLLAAAGRLSDLMGVDRWTLLSFGLGLAGFAVLLLVTAARDDAIKLRRESLWHACADFGWVAGTLIVLAGDWLTPVGDWLLVGVALPVLALGASQLGTLPSNARTAN